MLIRLLCSLALVVVSSVSLLANAESEAAHVATAEQAGGHDHHHPGPTVPHKHDDSQASKDHGEPQPSCVPLEKFSTLVAIAATNEMVTSCLVSAQWAGERAARAIEPLDNVGSGHLLELLVLSLASAPLAPPTQI